MSWAEIDLGAIRSNIGAIKSLLRPQTGLMAVVKANAYGHGMLEVSKLCIEAGAAYLAVANPEEALTLREGGIGAPILVLGWMPRNMLQLWSKTMSMSLFLSREPRQDCHRQRWQQESRHGYI